LAATADELKAAGVEEAVRAAVVDAGDCSEENLERADPEGPELFVATRKGHGHGTRGGRSGSKSDRASPTRTFVQQPQKPEKTVTRTGNRPRIHDDFVSPDRKAKSPTGVKLDVSSVCSVISVTLRLVS